MINNNIYVAVQDRNRILVHRVFRVHQRVQRATALSFRLGQGSYAQCGRIRYLSIYIARMNPTLSGSSALQRVKLGDVPEIRNGIIFDFYSGLPHMRKIACPYSPQLWSYVTSVCVRVWQSCSIMRSCLMNYIDCSKVRRLICIFPWSPRVDYTPNKK